MTLFQKWPKVPFWGLAQNRLWLPRRFFACGPNKIGITTCFKFWHMHIRLVDKKSPLFCAPDHPILGTFGSFGKWYQNKRAIFVFLKTLIFSVSQKRKNWLWSEKTSWWQKSASFLIKNGPILDPVFIVIFSCFWTSWEPWRKMQNSTNTKNHCFWNDFEQKRSKMTWQQTNKNRPKITKRDCF